MPRSLLLLFMLLPIALRGAAQTLVPSTDTAQRDQRLKEVTVKTNRAEQYSRDSAARMVPYRKAMKDAGSKMQIAFSNGLVVDGFFSETALRLSGKKRKLQEFAAEVRADEAARAARLYYSLADVRLATGLDSSAAEMFSRAHPVPLSIARDGSRLDILTWLRRTYEAEAVVVKE